MFFEDSKTPINENKSFKGKEIRLSIETKPVKPKTIEKHEYYQDEFDQTVGDLTQTANNSETKTLYFIGFDRNIYNTSGSSMHFRKFEQHSLINDSSNPYSEGESKPQSRLQTSMKDKATGLHRELSENLSRQSVSEVSRPQHQKDFPARQPLPQLIKTHQKQKSLEMLKSSLYKQNYTAKQNKQFIFNFEKQVRKNSESAEKVINVNLEKRNNFFQPNKFTLKNKSLERKKKTKIKEILST